MGDVRRDVGDGDWCRAPDSPNWLTCVQAGKDQTNVPNLLPGTFQPHLVLFNAFSTLQ